MVTAWYREDGLTMEQYVKTLLARAICALFVPVLLACRAEVTVTRHDAVQVSPDRASKVVFLAGPDSHGPWAHEHRAGAELLAAALRERFPATATINVYGGWPADESLLENADALVLYCDGGEGHLVNRHLAAFNRLLDQGTGVVALHYCVEVPKDSPSAAAMMRAVGAYFETHWSVNPMWEADFAELPVHPITTGIGPFRLEDEWYFNMRFVPGGSGVTPILSAVAPDSTMDRGNGPHSGNDAVRELVAARVPQVTAWAYERPGGGRGFGYTGGHYHANWQEPAPRNLVVNAIHWVASYRAESTQ